MSRRGKHIVSGAAAAGWTAALMAVTGYKPWHNIFIYLLAALYIFLFLRFFFLPRIVPRLNHKLIFVAAALVSAGCVFLFDIKFSESYYYSETEITVCATGRKDTAAEGSEIWIAGIKLDGRKADLTTQDGFRLIDNSLVSPAESQPETMTFSSEHADTVIIELAVNPWSGIAEITGSGERIEINLFDTDVYLGTREYDISALLNKDIRCAAVKRLIFYGLQLCLIYPLSVCLLYYVLRKRSVYGTDIRD
jgi:hypothetical protein